ncbi:Nn.00g077000.m01.CDS01 [Neocucurbitaria sp. VM-36]
MNYINRFFDHYSPTQGQTRPRFLHTTRALANSPQRHDPHHSDARRKRKRHRHQRRMTSFNGPWSKDLDSLKKTTQSMPEQYKSSYSNASKATVDKFCDPSVLHVWECNSDIDDLLQLTSVIAKICDLGVRKNKDIKVKTEDGSMLIIAEEKSGRDNYRRLCGLVAYLTEREGKKHLEGTVCSFGKIVVVRGWNSTILPTGTGNKEAAEKVVKRIDTAIERVLNMGGFVGGNRRIVWHHGPVIHFLLHWINTTTSTLRSAVSAITITGSLDLTNSVAPSNAGRANKLPDLERLESYAKKLSIPVVFLDSPSQLITFEYLGQAQDELVTFAFQLRGASENKYGNDVVRMVQKHLDASKAKPWARICVSKSSYDKTKSRAAGRDAAIHHAVQLADSPFALFNHGHSIPAFARLAVGPAAASSTASDYHIAAPVEINFKQGQLRPSNPATFHILIPAQSQDVEKVTNRIQGLMMAVLERVRQEKGNPELGDTERGMWKAVVKACSWAIDGCEGKMPRGVGEKVKFVKEKLREGTWGYALGAAPADATKYGSTAAATTPAAIASGGTNTAAMAEPNRTYGFGQGYGAGQTMGMYGYGGAEQQQGAMAPAPSLQGAGHMQHVQAQPQGIGTAGMGMVDPAMYAQGQGYGYGQGQGPGVSGQGYAPQQRLDGGYVQGQQSGAERYPQSMGGPW